MDFQIDCIELNTDKGHPPILGNLGLSEHPEAISKPFSTGLRGPREPRSPTRFSGILRLPRIWGVSLGSLGFRSFFLMNWEMFQGWQVIGDSSTASHKSKSCWYALHVATTETLRMTWLYSYKSWEGIGAVPLPDHSWSKVISSLPCEYCVDLMC